MKEKYTINKQEQIDLVSDPFVLSIISLIENDQVTIEWVAQELDEKISLVADYMDRLHKAGLLQLIVDGDQRKYQKIAASFEMGNESFRGQDIYHHFIFGLLHHLESNISDLLKLTAEFDDYHTELDKLGYGKTMASYTKLYLTKEEFKDFRDYLFDFFKKHSTRPDQELGAKRPYELVIDVSPELSCLRKLIKAREEDTEK